ncbi:head-to-tail connector [Corynebacterium phage CL31]|nr:head-to-tail connector [Corynebacterium phage CL31]
MSETILVLGEESYDDDTGELIPPQVIREVAGCVVDTAGQTKIDGVDVSDGNTDRLRILAPAGAVFREGEAVEVRGVVYRVKHIPFDYSVGRRPVLARHRPRTMVIVERKES